MGVWPGVAMDSLKFQLGPPCSNLLRPAGRPPLKRPLVFEIIHLIVESTFSRNQSKGSEALAVYFGPLGGPKFKLGKVIGKGA
jgi:hypothetical protein